MCEVHVSTAAHHVRRRTNPRSRVHRRRYLPRPHPEIIGRRRIGSTQSVRGIGTTRSASTARRGAVRASSEKPRRTRPAYARGESPCSLHLAEESAMREAFKTPPGLAVQAGTVPLLAAAGAAAERHGLPALWSSEFYDRSAVVTLAALAV